jgi:hypothetical protein
MCDRLCGNQPTDTAGKAIWRKRYYNNHDVWPRTDRQQKQDAIDEAAAKKREIERMNSSTEQAHPVVSPQMSEAPQIDHVAKVVEAWHKANPGFR